MHKLSWNKHGLILKAKGQASWLKSHTGASSLISIDDGKAKLALTARDSMNRSVIGGIIIDLKDFSVNVLDEPILTHGTLGAFDENGVSYPSVVNNGKELWMYYTGWVPTVLTPFQNFIGLAVSRDNGKSFYRYSKAPVLERTDDDFLSHGSCWVLKDNKKWHMWYTSFSKWERDSLGKIYHEYQLKYAESENGINWRRDNIVALPLEGNEICVAKPSVIRRGDRFLMWFCYRGEDYKIGFAESFDGKTWKRFNDQNTIALSLDGFDNKGQAYPCVFAYQGKLFMVYAGNEYGKSGIGIASASL